MQALLFALAVRLAESDSVRDGHGDESLDISTVEV